MRKTTKAVALLLVAVTIFLLAGCSGGTFDYTSIKLSDYITLEQSQYIDRTVEIEIPEEIDDDYVNDYVVQNFLKEADINIYKTDGIISDGDTVGIYFRATAETNGKTTDLSSNITDKDSAQCKLGEDTLKLGEEFEKKLVGAAVNPLKKTTNGTVKAGDVLYVTYKYQYQATDANGKTSTKTVMQTGLARWDLSKMTEEGTYGAGFAASLVGKSIGGTHVLSANFDASGDGIPEDVVVTVTVSFALEGTPTTFTVSYPADYEEEIYRNKEVTFHVYVSGRIAKARELLTEEIVTETIGYEVAEEDKDRVIDAFLEDTKEKLIEKREETIKSNAVSALWTLLEKDAKIKKYPEKAIDEYYERYYEQVCAQYDAYKDQLNVQSLDEFLRAQHGMPEKMTYGEFLRNTAMDEVKYRLIYYSIVDQQNLSVSQKDFEAERATYMEELLFYEEYNYYQNYGQYRDFNEQDLYNAYGKEEVENSIREKMLDKKVTDFLFENLNVTEKETAAAK